MISKKQKKIFKQRQLGAVLGLTLASLFATTLVARPQPARDNRPVDPDSLKRYSSLEQAKSQQRYVPGEVIVKYKPGLTDNAQVARTNGLGLQSSLQISRLKAVKARILTGETVEEAVERLRKDPMVEYAEPNYLYQKFAPAPNDTHWGKLWGLENTGQFLSSPSYTTNNPGTSGKDIDILNAWDVTSDCSATTVAVIDTGVNYSHEDLSANMWDGTGCVDENGTTVSGGCPNHGWDYVDDDNDPTDEEGHGSHVAATIGAVGNNNKGISGVCQTADIMAVRVIGHEGAALDDIAQGIQFAVRNGAKVINLSLGGGSTSSLMEDAIDYAESNDVVVIIAAGNSNLDLASNNIYPCELTNSNILCVAALDQDFERASFSNYDTSSQSSRSVDLGAPGTNIMSAYGNETVLSGSGAYTSWLTAGTGAAANWLSSTCGDGAESQEMLTVPDCTLYEVVFDDGSTVTTMPSSTDRRTYRNFSISSSATHVSLFHTVFAYGEDRFTAPYCWDYTRAAYSDSMGDPISGGTFLQLPDYNRGQYTTHFCEDEDTPFLASSSHYLEDCVGSTNCTVGYQVYSDSYSNHPGAFVTDITLTTWAPSNTAYSYLDGTSMAAPHVAGLAALLRAYNPDYSAADTIQKIIDGGESSTDISSTTKYGVSINADNSMRDLDQVTGVTATLQ
ncbi:MAG: peptidase S8 [Spirochaetaceae bacterium]|nr:peptidase S8 [Spirochaetaceae bacterium]|tara:strand:- start:2271 stop:4298 length:2028 start_codon:yes stop_codon:yes gene_type:complete